MTVTGLSDPLPPILAPSASPAKAGLRADIQALRAIAVAAVMLYHLWPNRLTGGYIGVDVFFAISGFLITSHLLGEVDSTGRLRIGRFWARRAKRLVPASSIVLLLSTLVVLAKVPRYLWHQFLDEITAASLQVENWLLARNSVDYLAANNVASPTQHFWTLGVEEQFYVALPLLMLASIALSRPLRVAPRQLILAGLSVIVAGSLAYSIWLTRQTPGVAYFSTATRAWEFGAGALLAFAGKSRRLHPVLPWVGVAGILAACGYFDAATAFPGFAAALPVLAAVLAIWSGRGSAFDRFGSFAPVALLGRISYAAYLWHWPLIVLLPFLTHRALGTVDKAGIILATLVLAWASTTFVEDPIRFQPRLLGKRRPFVVAIWAAAAIAVVVSISATAAHRQTVQDRRLASATRELAAERPHCLGAAAIDPKLAPCDNPALAGMLIPDPAQAGRDDDNLPECWGMKSANEPKVCQLGPTTGYRKRVLALGDSHNNTLIGAYRSIAMKNDWRIDVAGEGGCYLTSVRQQQPGGPAGEQVCNTWRAAVTAIANRGGYAAIIVTHSDRDRQVIPKPGETLEQATVRGLVEAWRQLPDVPIVAIRDNPSMPAGNLNCVSEHKATAAQDCAAPRGQALADPDGQAEAVKQVPRARLVDLTQYYCTATVCPPVIGHVLVYRDPTHLTATYAATLTPYLDAKVVAAIKD